MQELSAVGVADCSRGDVALSLDKCEAGEAGEAFSCYLIVLVAEGVDLYAEAQRTDVVPVAALAADIVSEEFFAVGVGGRGGIGHFAGVSAEGVALVAGKAVAVVLVEGHAEGIGEGAYFILV